jgi:hypothetical protein
MLFMVRRAHQELPGPRDRKFDLGGCVLIIGIGLCRLLQDFNGPVRAILVIANIGIAGYLAFLATIDVPMYVKGWRAEVANGIRPLNSLEGE